MKVKRSAEIKINPKTRELTVTHGGVKEVYELPGNGLWTLGMAALQGYFAWINDPEIWSDTKRK